VITGSVGHRGVQGVPTALCFEAIELWRMQALDAP
jgi:hypothetical protein